MNIKQKLYQMFILGMSGENTYKALENGASGIIFFTKDITSSEGFTTLVEDLKKHALIKPFFSIDQEGGRVERTLNIYGGTKYLSQKFAYEKGADFLKLQTEKICSELKSFGINLNFSPCVDVNSNPKNPIIGERAFSDNPNSVIEGAKIVIEAHKKFDIIPCIKHFPGHGDTSVDSHLELPVIDIPLKELEKVHIKPFKQLIENGIDMVMASHIYVKCFANEEIPVSLSKNALNYLKDTLNFNGIIISDDMYMKALAKYGFETACKMGVKAGINLFIYRDADDEIIDMIEKIANDAEVDLELKQNIENSYEKIIEFKTNKM